MSENPAQPEQHDSSPAGAAAADLGQRLLAKLIDFILLWVVNLLVIVPIIIGSAVSGAAMGFGGFSGSAFLAGLVSIALYLGYFVILEMTTGQTVGKMVLKLRVRGADGGNPSIEEAIKRNGWMIIGIIPVLGTLAMLAAAIFIIVTINNNTATRQGWHDDFAGGTSVTKEG